MLSDVRFYLPAENEALFLCRFLIEKRPSITWRQLAHVTSKSCLHSGTLSRASVLLLSVFGSCEMQRGLHALKSKSVLHGPTSLLFLNANFIIWVLSERWEEDHWEGL